MKFTKQLIPSRKGNLGIVTLNNPRPLHALTLEMVQSFQDILRNWCPNNESNTNDSSYNTTRNEDAIAALLVKSDHSETKTRAFCAGGDVKAVYQSTLQEMVNMDKVYRACHRPNSFVKSTC
jgi:enoyl-CoA hydratase/carnithine racemase